MKLVPGKLYEVVEEFSAILVDVMSDLDDEYHTVKPKTVLLFVERVEDPSEENRGDPINIFLDKKGRRICASAGSTDKSIQIFVKEIKNTKKGKGQPDGHVYYIGCSCTGQLLLWL